MAEEADIPATLTAKMTANVAFDLLVPDYFQERLIVDIPASICRSAFPGILPFNRINQQWMNKCNTRVSTRVNSLT